MGTTEELARFIEAAAAAYALEHLGGQSHSYTPEEFRGRLESHVDVGERSH